MNGDQIDANDMSANKSDSSQENINDEFDDKMEKDKEGYDTDNDKDLGGNEGK